MKLPPSIWLVRFARRRLLDYEIFYDQLTDHRLDKLAIIALELTWLLIIAWLVFVL